MLARLLSPDLGDFTFRASSSSARTASAPSQPSLAPDKADALSDLTELSDDGEPGDTTASGGASYGGSSADESHDSDEEVAQRLLPSQPRLSHDNRHNPKPWLSDELVTLRRGLDLTPPLHGRRFIINGRTHGRNGLLAEYIQRQTGSVRTAEMVAAKLKHLKAGAGDDVAFKQAVRGTPAARSVINSINWDARLGQDRFPHVKPAWSIKRMRSNRIRSIPKKRQTRSPVGEPSLPLAQAIPPPSHSSQPSPPDVPEGRTYQPAFPPPQVPTTAPFLFSSLSSPTPELSAFLTSFSPSHDFSSSAAALCRAGLAVPAADLASLIFLAPCFFEAFLDSAGACVASEGKGGTGDEMNLYEAAWLRKTLLRARKEATM